MGEKVTIFMAIFSTTFFVTIFLFYFIILEYSIELIFLYIAIIISLFITIIVIKRKELKSDISLKESLGLFLLSLCIFIGFLFLFLSSGEIILELPSYILFIPNFINCSIFIVISLYYFFKGRTKREAEEKK